MRITRAEFLARFDPQDPGALSETRGRGGLTPKTPTRSQRLGNNDFKDSPAFFFWEILFLKTRLRFHHAPPRVERWCVCTYAAVRAPLI